MITNLKALRAQLSSPTKFDDEFNLGDPRRLESLSLEQQKKRAKDLLREIRQENPAALQRYQCWHRNMIASAQVRLNDTQTVIAREYGFAQWAELKAHIEQAQIARLAIAQGQPTALDGDCRTLHIRCGNDIMHKLAVAGFNGDFISFADPYVQGRVPKTTSLDEFIRIRAAFLNQTLAAANAIERLEQDHDDLSQAKTYPRVTLWFEHDSHDQLILAKILHYFSDEANRPARVQLICVTHFPGVKRFNGLGQLPPQALRVLWEQFSDVTPAQLALGQHIWEAITANTPEPLSNIITGGTLVLPSMAPALSRHLQELPSVTNGLSLTEQLTLQILADKGAMNAARLFGWYSNHYEPLPFLGDSGYWSVLHGLANVEQPALTLEKRGVSPKDWIVALTPLGETLLLHKADWLELNRVDRWVGGVKINSRAAPHWRWEKLQGVVLRQFHQRT